MRALTLLQVNDLHGYLSAHSEIFDLGRPAEFRSGGGVARIATLFRAARKESPGGVMALDNGDTFHGTLPAVATRGEALLAPMSALGLDGMTAHWEFKYGLHRVGEMARSLPYPILAANFRDERGELDLPPYTVIERAGTKVGVIGLAAVVATALLSPDERRRVELTIGERELQALIPSLRRQHGVDLVVVLSHLGFPQDYKLAGRVTGIDVILSGHTHDRLEAAVVVGSTIIMQSGAHGSFVGRLDLEVAESGVAGWTHRLLPVDESSEADPDVAGMVDQAVAPFADARRAVLGSTEIGLDRYSMFESTMDNLLLAATAEAAGTQVALSNGWRYGAPIAPGPLTMLDAWTIVPANPPVSVVQLTGEQVRRLFEDNFQASFAADPWEQRGGYVKRCIGLEVLAKIENPAGHRVHEIRVDGERLAQEARVQVAFLGEQAVPAGVGDDRRAIGTTAVEALARYLRRRESVSPALTRPITVI